MPTASNSTFRSLAPAALYGVPALLICVSVFLYAGRGAQTSPSFSGAVQVVGSESMRPIVTAIAEDFMTRNPLADVIVKGGGSGDGIAALLHGIADIGMTSRDLTPQERAYAGDRRMELSPVPLALDAVVLIVNRANPIAALDLGQVQDIFAGKIRNWREFEGAEAEILPFARAAGSGTAHLFGDRVLAEESLAASVSRLPTNEAIVAAVAARGQAIGYTGLGALRGSADRVKMIALRADEQSAPAMATAAMITSGSYPLSRKLYLLTAGRPLATATAFVDFCLSESEQALFQRAGYIGIGSAPPAR